MTTYKIPILSIQDSLMSIDDNESFKELKKFCIDNLDPYFEESFIKFEFNLERRWFPVVVTNDRDLAWKVIRDFVQQLKNTT
jgi:hypothetical protein